ncbi:MAG: alpha/beta hydrolase [Pseudomonadota bacterium]
MSSGPPPFHGALPGGRSADLTWWFRAGDGIRLRGGVWHAPQPRGHVIFFQGRTEFLEKLTLPIAALVKRGFSVAALDWRGQGLSDRLASPAAKGHVPDFSHYQRDLEAFLDQPQVASLTGPRLVMAHSMGGLIAVAALARPFGQTVQGAMLSAPLLGLKLSAPTRTALWVVTRLARILGLKDRWPPSSGASKPYVLTNPSDNILTGNDKVWRWLKQTAEDHPELTLAMPTIGWLDAALQETARVATLPAPPCPACCLLGSDEDLVDPDAIRAWTAQHAQTLIEVPDGRHEVLVETDAARAVAWAGLDQFLDRLQLPESARY